MATYKVIQDIEAEDKILGPLTLKQFVFAAIALGIGFVEFKLITLTGLGVLRWPLAIVLFIPMLVFGFLAAPISREQPNDIWLLARLRFILKPHKRIWDQDGISQLVTINAPKKIEEFYSDGLSQTEVRSRLSALANTLDSRGWAVKNVDVNLYDNSDYIAGSDATQRLIDPQSLPTDTQAVDIHASDDIMDPNSNPVAQHLEQLVQASTESHKQQVMQTVKTGGQNPQPANDYWFMNQPQTAQPIPAGYTSFKQPPVVQPGSQTSVNDDAATVDEAAIAAELRAKQAAADTYNTHLKNIQPLHQLSPSGQAVAQTGTNTTQNQPNDQGQTASNPAILGLASNDDLDVATIARQANKLAKGDDEVVISLH